MDFVNSLVTNVVETCHEKCEETYPQHVDIASPILANVKYNKRLYGYGSKHLAATKYHIRLCFSTAKVITQH
ncbi:hypothetical protein EB796_009685 [Bugula neritina]|uniref:Uncharacterized protein n=1 Tax=Bugula neritina TaxID=10212 RepID=A0A7J7K227_BUGNE|nr:hypothetical protein EB796_009685 [Bugula neritina]